MATRVNGFAIARISESIDILYIKTSHKNKESIFEELKIMLQENSEKYLNKEICLIFSIIKYKDSFITRIDNLYIAEEEEEKKDRIDKLIEDTKNGMIIAGKYSEYIISKIIKRMERKNIQFVHIEYNKKALRNLEILRNDIKTSSKNKKILEIYIVISNIEKVILMSDNTDECIKLIDIIIENSKKTKTKIIIGCNNLKNIENKNIIDEYRIIEDLAKYN